MGSVNKAIDEAIDGPDLPGPTGHSGMSMYEAMGGMQEPGQYQYAPPSVTKNYPHPEGNLPNMSIAQMNHTFQEPDLDELMQHPEGPPSEDVPIDQQNRNLALRNRMQHLSEMASSTDGPGIAIKQMMGRVVAGRATPDERKYIYNLMLGEKL